MRCRRPSRFASHVSCILGPIIKPVPIFLLQSLLAVYLFPPPALIAWCIDFGPFHCYFTPRCKNTQHETLQCLLGSVLAACEFGQGGDMGQKSTFYFPNLITEKFFVILFCLGRSKYPSQSDKQITNHNYRSHNSAYELEHPQT